MNVTALALTSCAVMLGWLVLTEWVPLAPLNDLEASTTADRAKAAAVNYTVLVLIAGGVLIGSTAGAIVAEVLAAVWLIGHVVSWWLPYFGVSFERQREAYRRDYSRTLKILPSAGHDVVVDVQHMVVGLLSLTMLAFVTMHLVDVVS